jgi:DNA-binding NarL/FixJ family response regulator
MTPVSRTRRIVIVDDHTLFREGLRTILEMEDDIEVVADAETAEDVVELVWRTRPDVLLLDIRMPQGSGLDAVPAVLRISPRTSVLVLTACDEKEEHVRAFRLGARGVVLKDSARQTLMQAIRAVCMGAVWVDPRMAGALAEELTHPPADGGDRRDDHGLTERELEIVRLVATGHRNKEVGATLTISERTVKTHLTNIFQKLGVRDRVGLVMYALHHGLASAARALPAAGPRSA